MTTTITAERAARALVTASRLAGIDPLTVFAPEHEFVRVHAATAFPCLRPSQISMLTRVFRLRHPDCNCCTASGAA